MICSACRTPRPKCPLHGAIALTPDSCVCVLERKLLNRLMPSLCVPKLQAPSATACVAPICAHKWPIVGEKFRFCVAHSGVFLAVGGSLGHSRQSLLNFQKHFWGSKRACSSDMVLPDAAGIFVGARRSSSRDVVRRAKCNVVFLRTFKSENSALLSAAWISMFPIGDMRSGSRWREPASSNTRMAAFMRAPWHG